MFKKNFGSSVTLFSTKALSKEALHFVTEMNWSLESINMIETRCAVSRVQIHHFLELCKKKNKKLVLIFSSVNAIKHLVDAIKHFGFEFPAGLLSVCVGKKTKHYAEVFLQAFVLYSETNSTQLLNRLLKDFSPEYTFIYCCGNRRLAILPNGMKGSGFSIEEFVVYETVLTPATLINNYDTVLFFSPSAVDSFFGKNTWSSNVLAVSIGNSTSERLGLFGVKNICEAETPGEIPMLEKLRDYLSVPH
jgi:uroporphyrinogen-III synthase